MEETNTSQIETKNNGALPTPDFGSDSESLHSFHFKLPVFEGPLDLLLHLIRENKIDIYDIPVAEITNQYLQYIDLMKELNLEVAGEFLVMAATLIHIKSRTILPTEEEETEEPVEDPRAELVRRLIEYQSYKESSIHLRKREELWKTIFHRPLPDKDNFELGPEPILFEASAFDLITAFKKLLERAPGQVIEITRETLTVAERINYIVERLEREKGIRFEELFEDGFTKMLLIVTFLAVLELVRLGLVKIYQEKEFGIIWVMSPKGNSISTTEETAQEVLS